MHSNQANNLYGTIFMLTHCMLYAAHISLIKIIGDEFDIFQLLFIQSAISLLLITFYMPFAGQKGLHIVRKKLHIIRAVLVFFEFLMFFYVCKVVSATNIAAITLTYPLFTTIMAVIFLGEKIKTRRIMGLVIGFLGALIVVRPGLNSFEAGSVLALFVMLVWGVLDVLIKIMNRTEPIPAQMFYIMLLLTIFYMPFAVISWRNPASLNELFLLAALSTVYTLYILAIFLAFKYSEVSALMPVYFSELIFVDLAAFFLFDDIPDFWNIFGSSVIIISVLYIAHRERMAMKKSRQLIESARQ
jgi:drug/metabolite transporter (DMT)-like permease